MIEFLSERFGSNGFLNETLWIGHLGHFTIVFSFISSLLAAFAYGIAELKTKEEEKSPWKTLARYSFLSHFFMVLFTFVILFLMILNHHFEYHYAWRHSSTALPIKYIISSFWEGQEGSFLLWEFWIAIMGLFVIRKKDMFEEPVMCTVSLTQAFLGSMVLGIYFLGHKIGSNPFVLLRNEMTGAPIFSQPNYLDFIKDGNGLNPLLQNYWMTIHPPVLFSGFAAGLFPFAYSVAALIRNNKKEFITPILQWSLVAIGTLGTGIIMGGAWAYESLSFGGFWAWDPVENMSLVPWLLILAGMHLILVYKNTGHSLTSMHLFLIFGFVTILYSTFLTRSGILGDTSVHAFTDLGMQGQLLIYLFFFLIPSLILVAFRHFTENQDKPEEPLWSREFWIFIGSLMLLLSAVQMTFTTSIPVWNKLFGLNLAPPEEAVSHYNNFQIWIGILLAFLTGLVQYFAYKQARILPNFKWFNMALAISVILGIATCYFWDISFVHQHKIDLTSIHSSLFFKVPFFSSMFLFTVTSWLTLVANIIFIVKILKVNLNVGAGSIAHIGFGIFLLGVIISQHKKEIISINKSELDFGNEFKPDEKSANVFLVKDSATKMGDYWVTYKGMKQEKPNTLYEVLYQKGNEKFTLFPNAQLNPKMGLLANPDTKHYLTKDIFTHITSVPDNSELKDSTTEHSVMEGDTFYTASNYVIFKTLIKEQTEPELLSVKAILNVKSLSGDSLIAEPIFNINTKTGIVSYTDDELEMKSLTFRFKSINPETKKVTFEVKEKEKALDFIILKAIVFPYINLVWFGSILCFAGVGLSWWNRRKLK